MKIAFNPSTVAALTTPPNNKDITFDLRGRNIFARGVKFYGTDTNTWRDIKINNVSIGSHTLDLQNGSNTTLTNTNGVVTINSTWRPVVDNLTSDSTTSSLSAKQGKVLKSLIDGKSNSGHTHDDRYLKLTGGTMASNALITFADSGSWGTDKGPQGARGGLYWTGQSDYAKLYAEETIGDNLDLVIQFGDDNYNGLSIRNKANTQTSYISSSGVITTGTFKGNLDWSYITNKPSSYTPSAHTHAWNSLTHSSTTENQAILTNGKANGWKLQTLNIARWDNAANNAHSHANKSVLDGITSALVNSWNTAYNFVSNITGTDTDKVINKWEEIVNFLAGITEDNKLNTLLNSKLSIQQLSAKDILTTKTNNALFWVDTKGNASTITTGPFTDHPYALLSVTNYNQNAENYKFFYRSRLAFSSAGDIKVASCHHENEYQQDETWYNVLTSKNSGINGSTIKLNGTSITVYSSGTADGRYVKKSGDTMSGVLTIDTTNFGALTIKRNDDANGASIQFRGKSSIYGYIGLNNSTKDKQFLRWSSDTSRVYTILDTSSTYISNGKGIINGTTITQVDNATNSTNSTNARKLVNWYSARPTSLNAQFGDGSLRIFYATSSTIEGKPAEDSHILHLAWDNTGGWDAQLAVHTSSGKVSTRAQNGGTWQPWKTLAFTTDIPSSLKNPYSFNVFGVVYDGSAAKTVTTSNFISQVNEGTSTITDGTMLITSYASNSGFADTNAINVPYKRKAIHLWEYIKVKTDSLYYTESEVNSLLSRKLDRVNLTTGSWNPRGYHLAADYHYNGGDISISENNGKMYVSVDGCFWQNEGQYRVLDTSDIGDIRDSVTLHQYLSATDAAWYPLVWGGAFHNNTSDSTGPIYKSYDKLSWQTSSQTLYATNIQTNNIKNLSIGGGIYWNPNVESASDGTDAASITLVRSGVAGGTTLVLSQQNDTDDTIQFKTNTAARLYHNSYPILTTQNTYVSNNKGYINGLEITQVNNADTLDGYHESSFLRFRGRYEDASVTKDGVGVYGWDKDCTGFHESYGDIINIQGYTTWRTRFDIGTSGRIRIVHGINTTTATQVGYLAYLHDNVDSATNAYHLRINSANSWSTWYWAGQSGQPSWLWGSNDGTNMYVWNPSNFNVNTAQYLRSLGNQNCQTGRTQAYGDVYSYNTYNGNTGSPTTYSSVIGFGRGIAGTVEIAGGWCNTHLYWRSLIDCCEDWFPWRTVLDSSNYTEFINNYYWANVKISASSSTTTSPTVHTLTATRVCAGHNPGIDNSISCSNWFRSSGNTGWYNTTYQGGWYMSDTSWIRAHNGVGIYTSGQIYSSSSIRMGSICLERTSEINSSDNLLINYRSSADVDLCQGGGNVCIGATLPTQKLDVRGNIITKGLGIQPYYLSKSVFLPTIRLNDGYTYKCLEISATTEISCIIADRAGFMSERGILIKFNRGYDGQIILLKDLQSCGSGNGYFWVMPSGCKIIHADNSSILVGQNQISNVYDDGRSRFLVYSSVYSVWIEFLGAMS